MLTRKQILSALRAAARQLGNAPTRAEFLRLTGIHPGRLFPHFPDGYRSAIRAAGLPPIVVACALILPPCSLIGPASPAKKAVCRPATNMIVRDAMPSPAWKSAAT